MYIGPNSDQNILKVNGLIAGMPLNSLKIRDVVIELPPVGKHEDIIQKIKDSTGLIQFVFDDNKNYLEIEKQREIANADEYANRLSASLQESRGRGGKRKSKRKSRKRKSHRRKTRRH